jgi:hypothetical protein
MKKLFVAPLVAVHGGHPGTSETEERAGGGAVAASVGQSPGVFPIDHLKAAT